MGEIYLCCLSGTGRYGPASPSLSPGGCLLNVVEPDPPHLVRVAVVLLGPHTTPPPHHHHTRHKVLANGAVVQRLHGPGAVLHKLALSSTW